MRTANEVASFSRIVSNSFGWRSLLLCVLGAWTGDGVCSKEEGADLARVNVGYDQDWSIQEVE
jgi:hypothetical protein